jgi:hypothetical protein
VVVQRPVQCNGVIASERPHWDGHIPMRLSSHYTNERNQEQRTIPTLIEWLQQYQ